VTAPLERLAARLSRLRHVPGAVLALVVRRDGSCMRPVAEAEPRWQGEHLTDRELAAELCSGCPVPDECLELELRTAGPHTVGVWGGLPDDDRRTLHRHWIRLRTRDTRDDIDDSKGGAP